MAATDPLCLIRTLCRAAPYMQYLVHHHRRAPNSAGCTKCIYGIRAKYPAAWEPLGCTEPPKVRWMEARLDSDCTACIQAQLQCVAALHLHSSVVALCMCRSAAAYRSSFTSGRECSCTRIWTRHTTQTPQCPHHCPDTYRHIQIHDDPHHHPFFFYP